MKMKNTTLILYDPNKISRMNLKNSNYGSIMLFALILEMGPSFSEPLTYIYSGKMAKKYGC